MKRLFCLTSLACVSIGFAQLGPQSGGSVRLLSAPPGVSGGVSTNITDTVQVTLSIGDVAGGISTNLLGDVVLKSGFIGQLYDVKAITLGPSGGTVDEGGTRQLTTDQVLLDDDSTLVLDPSNLTWSVRSGPLAGIDADGVVTAITPIASNELAEASAGFLGTTGTVQLTVLDIDKDNFGNYAGDGMHDDYQIFHFGLNNPNAAPNVDADQPPDGRNNLQEFMADTDPNDPNDFFTVRIERVPGQPGQANVVFGPRRITRNHRVVFADALHATGNAFNPLAAGDTADDGEERTVTDPNAGNFRVYRVELSVP